MVLAKVFHLIAIVHFYYGFWYDRKYMTKPDSEWRGYEFGGRLVYLTLWNVIFQCIYYTLAFINDFIGTNEALPNTRPLIRKIRDYFFATFAFPFAMNVGLLFHALMIIDRNTVMPAEVDAFFPFWLNHLVHTNIMIFILIEFMTLPRNYPCRKLAMGGMGVIMAVYLGWIFCIYANTNKWVYPILAMLNWPLRIAFFVFTVSIPVVFYFVGEFINSVRWGSSTSKKVVDKQTSKKKKQKDAMCENEFCDISGQQAMIDED